MAVQRSSSSMRIFAVLACAFICSLAAVVYSQNPSAPPKQEPPIRVLTEEVVVDVIVTDKNGNSVTTLTAGDFEVYEDKLRQQIKSFRLESRGQSGVNDSTRAGAAATPGNRPASAYANLVSLVFDTTSIARDGALEARRAAEDYVKNLMTQNDYVAVFSTGIGLNIFKPFTQDRAALLKAVEQVTSGDLQKFGSITNEIRAALETVMGGMSNADKYAAAYDYLGVNAPSPLSMVPSDRAGTGARQDESGQAQPDINSLAYASLRTLLQFQRYEREYQGRMNVSGLLSIIDAQRVFPGRKSLLYFSGGFTVAPAVSEQFQSVISAANRAHVTIYSIDASGLRLDDPNLAAGTEINAIISRRMANPNPELVSQGQSALGRVEEAGRMNTLNTLEELSSGTGGSTIKNTNEFKTGMRRIMHDLNEYYVLTYAPTNQTFDGHFRNISVKINRPDLFVRSRSGYYAFRSRDTLPLLAYEAQLLEVINSPAPATDFGIALGGYHFCGKTTDRLAAFFVEFPMSGIKLEQDKKKKTYQGQVDTMILLKEPGGTVIRRLSRVYNLDGSLDQMDNARKLNISFIRRISIPPGEYLLDAVVRDRLTGRAAVQKGKFVVEPVDLSRLQVSSLILGKNAVPASGSDKNDKENPFLVQDSANVMPDLWRVYKKSADKHVLIYFSVYPPQATASAVQATLDFFQNGKPFLRSGGKLPGPDAAGRIQYVTTFGLENFQPGEYFLRVTVKDGQSSASAESPFRVEQ